MCTNGRIIYSFVGENTELNDVVTVLYMYVCIINEYVCTYVVWKSILTLIGNYVL